MQRPKWTLQRGGRALDLTMEGASHLGARLWRFRTGKNSDAQGRTKIRSFGNLSARQDFIYVTASARVYAIICVHFSFAGWVPFPLGSSKGPLKRRTDGQQQTGDGVILAREMEAKGDRIRQVAAATIAPMFGVGDRVVPPNNGLFLSFGNYGNCNVFSFISQSKSDESCCFIPWFILSSSSIFDHPTSSMRIPPRLTVGLGLRFIKTQGLTYVDGVLYKLAGLRGHSKVCKLNATTGEIILSVDMDPWLFAEGMAHYGNDKLIQITWKKQKGFVWNTTLEVL